MVGDLFRVVVLDSTTPAYVLVLFWFLKNPCSIEYAIITFDIAGGIASVGLRALPPIEDDNDDDEDDELDEVDDEESSATCKPCVFGVRGSTAAPGGASALAMRRTSQSNSRA